MRIIIILCLLFIVGCVENDNNPLKEDLTTLDPPNAVALDTAYQITHSGIMMRWATSKESDFSHYAVYRDHEPGTSASSTLIAEIDDISTFRFLDSAVTSGEHYYYTIAVVNTLGGFTVSNETHARMIDYGPCAFGTEIVLEHYANNPIIPLDSDWNYATVLDPMVVVINDSYFMWYGGRGTTPYQIGFASSDNGYEWNIYESNPIITFGDINSFDEFHLRFPNVIYDEGIYKMWYTGADDNFAIDLAVTAYSVGYAESTDGLNWVKHQDNPVLEVSAGEWDDLNIFLGSVVKHNGKYHLWYNGYSSRYDVNVDAIQNNNIVIAGYAASEDGINWVKHGYPVLTPGPLDFDARAVYVFDVNISDDGYFEMLYTANPFDESRTIARALSFDGINWAKDEINPIIKVDPTISEMDYELSSPHFIRTGNNYRFWFTGQNGFGTWNIGTADGTLICE